MVCKILAVFIIAGIYSAVSLFIESIIKKLFDIKGKKVKENNND